MAGVKTCSSGDVAGNIDQGYEADDRVWFPVKEMRWKTMSGG
jgi:hypothetical protein